jgi:hypothetical protein
LIRFSRGQKMRALEFELLAHGLLDRSVANHRLLRRADRSVVKTLTSQNILHRLRHIGSSLDAHRHVTWSNSERWFS